jgi:hypothetical protein
MKKFAFIFALTATLAGCATPYQPNGMTGGFNQLQLKDDIWRVSFNGNGFTSHETAQTYWLYRCAELSIEKGYDGFELLSNIQLVMPLTPEQFFGVEQGFKPTAHAAPVYIPIYTDQSRFPRIEADIRFIKKPFKANPPRVFDAQQLKSTLEPIVTSKEKCSAGGSPGNVCPHLHDYIYPLDKFEKAPI